MVKSMTGFGRAVAELDGYVITIELKSVNHRYFEFYSRCPRQYGFIDDKSSLMSTAAFPEVK